MAFLERLERGCILMLHKNIGERDQGGANTEEPCLVCMGVDGSEFWLGPLDFAQEWTMKVVDKTINET